MNTLNRPVAPKIIKGWPLKRLKNIPFDAVASNISLRPNQMFVFSAKINNNLQIKQLDSTLFF